MAPFNGEPSHSQQVALAIVPKVTASLSLLGSGYIIYDCWRSKQRIRRERNTYHRLMTGLSVCDMIMSMGIFFSTWPMPKGTPHVYGAVGNTRTCTAQGFFEQIGVAAVGYNASLSVYYYLRVRKGWPLSRIIKVEPWLHAVPLTFGIATMIAGLFLKLYNFGIWDCWVAPYPLGCKESWRNGGYTDCIRGNNATIYIWVFDLIPKWFSIFVVTLNMWLTYLSVRSQEGRTKRYSMRNTQEPSLSKRLARQSYLYVGALYITYLPVIVTRLSQLISGFTYYGMILSIAITIPLQGFWNFLVYLRPRYLKARRRQRTSSSGNGSFFRAVSEAVREGDVNDEEESTTQENSKGNSSIPIGNGESFETSEKGESFRDDENGASNSDRDADEAKQ